jgi:hypothetical protein
MAAKDEHPERYGWWINELESLGLSVKKTNEFNDLMEIQPGRDYKTGLLSRP